MADETLPTSRGKAKSLGTKYYATGLACAHGHITRRLTANGTCCECQRIRAIPNVARWKALKDPAWLRAYVAATARKTRAKDVEKARAKGRVQRARVDPSVLSARQKSWRERNAEHCLEYAKAFQKSWRQANPIKASIKSRAAEGRRRAREQGAVGTYTDDDIAWLLAEQGGKCAGFWCDIVFGGDFTVDHRDPISRGGTNWPTNLALLCKSCNSRKSARTMPEWFQSQGGTY